MSEDDYFVCPQCGCDVPVDALACRECGADDETGWSDMAYVGELDLPETGGYDDDYDEEESSGSGGILPAPLVAFVAALMAIVWLLVSL